MKTLKNYWLVLVENEIYQREISSSLEEATRYVFENLVRPVNRRPFNYESQIDDFGKIDFLSWAAPSRAMTKQEAIESGNLFAKNWIKSKCMPLVPDFEKAALHVNFLQEPISSVQLIRADRYAGYLNNDCIKQKEDFKNKFGNHAFEQASSG